MNKSVSRIYRIKWKDNELLYAPLLGEIKDLKRNKTHKIQRRGKDLFWNKADMLAEKPLFKPFCLTVYAGNKCNLTCSYCYIPEKKEIPSLRFDPNSLTKAAHFVAQNCVAQKMPFILGFHGGNEPLLYTDLMKDVLAICNEIAKKYHLPLQAYCTSNGVISEKVATWAAQTLFGITLSWDGPAAIHNKYRPHINGTDTESTVQKTLGIFIAPSSKLNFLKVRATVSQNSVDKLLEIVQYFHQHNIRHVDLFPVYQDLSSTVSAELVPDPISFVRNFLLAKKWGTRKGMEITYANTRIGDFHDKHCSLFQQNLSITPDGFYTACFQSTHNFGQQHAEYMYGRISQESRNFEWDQQKLSSLYAKLQRPYEQCRTCFNQYHGAKECPSVCPITSSESKMKSFDCRVEKYVGIANVLKAAGINIADEELENSEDYFAQFEISPTAK